MSTSIDNRVVSMEFDNKNFENNVKTSLSTLEKLKQSLNLKGVTKGLDSISSSAKKVDMSPVGKAAETVGLKFSAMYTMADQALRNITNSAMLAGKRIVSALTIDPIKTGFQEYETKIGSIQTIMSNTASKGTTMDDVVRVIDELNTYADKTIYNFSEMTRNIGTFTAAGVGLEESAAAIQGIANLAASSGSTSQQASTAMYQLSQALAAGTVKLMDWNSVVNAGMGGEKFQEALKATARDHGVAVDDMIKKAGSFRESLQDGWITADILNETLNKFTVDGAKNYADSMMKSGKWTKAQADALVKEAQAMEDAATKVKTFTQLWDTMKESAQSGWGKTWELIVGNFDEAKELWTNVSEVLGGIINDSADKRNKVLDGALTSNWDKMIRKINEAGVETAEFEKSVRKVAQENNIPLDRLIQKYGSFEKAVRSGSISADVLKEALTRLTKAEVDLSGVRKNMKKGTTGEDVKKIQTALDKLGISLGKYGVDGKFGKFTEAAVKEFQKLNGLKVTGVVDDATLKALKEATDTSVKFKENIDELVKGFKDLGGREKLINSFKNMWNSIIKIAKPVREAFKDIFYPEGSDTLFTSEQIYNAIDAFEKLTKKFDDFLSSATGEQILSTIGNAFKTLFSIFSTGFDVFVEAGKAIATFFGGVWELSGGLSGIVSTISDLVAAFGEWIVESGVITTAIGFIAVAIEAVISGAKKLGGALKKLGGFLKDSFISAFGKGSKIGDYAIENFEKIKNGFKAIQELFKKPDALSFEGIEKAFTTFGESVVSFIKGIDFSALKESAKNAFKAFADSVSEYLGMAGDKFDGIIGKIKDFVNAIKEYIADNIGSIAAIGALLGIVFVIKKIYDLLSTLAKPLEFVDNLSEVLEDLGKTTKFAIKAQAIKNIAIAVGILAGSLIALAMVPWQKLVPAVIAMAAVIGGLLLVIKAVGKMDVTKLGDMAKLSGFIMGLSGALMVFAIAAKTIAGIEMGDLAKTAVVIAGFIVVVKSLAKITDGLKVGNIAKFGSMMAGLAGSLLILSIAIGILGNMDIGTLLQGGAAVFTFLGMMVGMMAATNLLAKYIPKFAGAMAGLCASLLILSVATGILGNMKLETLLKGGTAIFAFLAMMAGMMAATRLLEADMPKFGATMLGLSVGLMAMATAIKIIAGINLGDLVKGGLVVYAMLTVFKGFMELSKKLTKHSANAGKIGLMMLSFAASIVLLTGAIAVLSLINLGDLAKAVLAIGAIGVIFGGIVALTKYAKVGKNVKTTLLAMAGAIAVLALSVAALSMVKGEKLAGATAALSAIMGMFALLNVSTKFIGTKLIGKLIVMVGVVALLGGILKMLSDIPDPNSALSVAKGLSLLIASLSASLILIGAAGMLGPAALATGIAAFGALVALIGIFAGLAVASLPTIGNKLSEFMKALQPFLEGAQAITPEFGQGIKNFAEGISILAGAALTDKLGSLGGGSPLSKFGSSIKEFGKGLSEFLKSVSSPLDESGKPVEINYDNVTAAIDAAIRLSELSGLIPDTSGLSTKLGKKDLGNFGDQISNFADGLNNFLTKISDPFNKLDGKNPKAPNTDFKQIDKALDVAERLAGLDVPEETIFAKITGKTDLSVYADDIVSFADGLKTFISTIGTPFKNLTSVVAGEDGIKMEYEPTEADWKQVDKVIGIAKDLTKLDIPDETTFANFVGATDLSRFSTDIVELANGLRAFITAVGTPFKELTDVVVGNDGVKIDYEPTDVDWEQVDKVLGIAKDLTKLDVPDESDFANFTGSTDLSSFSTDIVALANGLTAFISTVGTPFKNLTGVIVGEDGVTLDYEPTEADWEQVDKVIGVANKLAELDVPKAGEWSKITGNTDLGLFAGDLSTLATGLKTFIGEVGTPFTQLIQAMDSNGVKTTTAIKKDINWEQIESAIGVAKKLAELDIPEEDWWSKFTEKTDLSTFSEDIKTFAGGLVTFITDITDGMKGLETVGTDGTINTKGIDAALKIAETLVEIANLLPDSSWMDKLFGGKLDDFSSDIEKFAGGLSAFATNTSEIAPGSATGATELAKELATISNLEIDTDSLETFGNAIVLFGGDLGTFVDEISELNPIEAMSIVSLINTLLTSITTITSTKFDSDNNTFYTALDTFRTKMYAFLSVMSSLDSSTIGTVTTSVDSAVSILSTVAGTDYTGVTDFCAKLDLFRTSMYTFSTLLSLVDPTLAITSAGKIIQMFIGMSAIDYTGVDSFTAKLSALTTSINGFNTTMANNADLSTNIDNLISSLTKFEDIDLSGISSFGDELARLGTEMVTKFVNAFVEATPKITTAGKNLTNSLVKGMNEKRTMVGKVAQAITKDAKKKVDDYKDDFTTAGEQLAAGLAAGIKAGESSVINAAIALASAAISAAEETLGIESPSKEFMAIGKFTGMGFVKALNQYNSKVYNASSEMASYAKRGFSEAIAKVSDLVTNGIDDNITIRPVMDLSEVYAGVDTVNGMLGFGSSVGMRANVSAVSAMMNRRNQNGTNGDIVSAIKDLGRHIDDNPRTVNNINGITYDSDSTVNDAVRTLIRAAKVERRM